MAAFRLGEEFYRQDVLKVAPQLVGKLIFKRMDNGTVLHGRILEAEAYRGVEYQVQFNAKVKLEVVVSDDMAQKAVTAIRETANTGNIGDGKIFIYDLADVVRIRTGETGEQVI